jgi:hypothetical protein
VHITHTPHSVLSFAFAGGLIVYVPVRLLVGCVVIDRSCCAGSETASENDAASTAQGTSYARTLHQAHILPIRTFFKTFAFR